MFPHGCRLPLRTVYLGARLYPTQDCCHQQDTTTAVVVHRTAGRLSALSARRPPSRLGSGRRQMVSITFDEFHAIRSRQRAAAEVVDSSKIKNDAAGDATSSAKPPSHTDPDERGAGSSVTGRRRTASSKFSSHGGSDEGEEVAPTSGSVSKVRRFLASSFFFLLVCVDTLLRGSCWCTVVVRTLSTLLYCCTIVRREGPYCTTERRRLYSY